MLLTAAIVGMFLIEPPLNAIILGVAIVVEVAEVYGWIWFLRRYRVATGAEGMIGERAVVIATDGSEGTVRVHGEIWKARFGSTRAVGDEVAVVEINGLTVHTD